MATIGSISIAGWNKNSVLNSMNPARTTSTRRASHWSRPAFWRRRLSITSRCLFPTPAVDPDWPDIRSRVVIPIRFSDTIVGVLDLHSHHSTQHTRGELIGLQALANQLGIGIRNAELYSEAVLARSAAERANLLKTRLLANVSHELRTPLDIIMH